MSSELYALSVLRTNFSTFFFLKNREESVSKHICLLRWFVFFIYIYILLGGGGEGVIYYQFDFTISFVYCVLTFQVFHIKVSKMEVYLP